MAGSSSSPSISTQLDVLAALVEQFDSINLKTRSLPKFVMECKRQNSTAFTIKIDITKSLVAYPNPISEETRIPPAMAVAELLEAADMFDFISADETPLSLTPPQRQLRDILLKHAWTTLYCGSSNGGAGRLVQGCKGVAKTTTFMMVQGILSTLLPNENLVFFASLRAQSNVFETFAKAYAQRRRLDEAPLWQSFEDIKAVCGSRNKFLAYVDEYHVTYTRDDQWRETACTVGQSAAFGAFALTGDVPYLRALAFGKASVEDVKENFPFYTTTPNLNDTRYTVVEMEPCTTRETVQELATILGVSSAAELCGYSGVGWLNFLAMMTGGLTCHMAQVAKDVRQHCSTLRCRFMDRLRDETFRRELVEVAEKAGELGPVLQLANSGNWLDLPLQDQVNQLREMPSSLTAALDAVPELDIDLDTKLSDVDKHLGNPDYASLLQDLGHELLNKTGEGEVNALVKDPFALMTKVDAANLLTKYGARMLYGASDSGAIRYDGTNISFGTPLLAQRMLDHDGALPREAPDTRGCDAVWFTVNGSELTVHRCQVKLGYNSGNPVAPSKVREWSKLLVGHTARRGAIPFDNEARLAFEKTLRKTSNNDDISVRVHCYLIMTRPLASPANLAQELKEELSTAHLTFDLWHHEKCLSDLWPREVQAWAKQNDLKAYYRPE
ncbi:uncharacterized protein MONBRDRAFT_37663 [Monosiga brevicollis MX1]|uniref:Uncharacterized protein n=1 Tax=Monosiga brevicollis TaxID=81824 RepID=A9V356_MONBE|nr:uncharacterized protein MONBRDRAFT_37663 [Monosiga brevicollis MX1]EDQ88130.1 predicted protein [Monosiga brevicollis MX1]|eukprot:XP_001747206.1 hypothetical protein [Monosiga brevicollis MX1]